MSSLHESQISMSSQIQQQRLNVGLEAGVGKTDLGQTEEAKKKVNLAKRLSGIFNKVDIEKSQKADSPPPAVQTHQVTSEGSKLTRATKRLSQRLSRSVSVRGTLALKEKTAIKEQVNTPENISELASGKMAADNNKTVSYKFKGSQLVEKTTIESGSLLKRNQVKKKIMDFAKSTYLTMGGVAIISTVDIKGADGKKMIVKQARDVNVVPENADDLRKEYQVLTRLYGKMGNPKRLPGVQKPPFALVKLSKQAQAGIENEKGKAKQAFVKEQGVTKDIKDLDVGNEAILFHPADCSLNKCLALDIDEKHKVFHEVLNGVSTFQQAGLFHNDIKLENVLVDFTADSLKKAASDEGALRLESAGMNDYGGCVFHEDINEPEQLLHAGNLSLSSRYTLKSDLYELTQNSRAAIDDPSQFSECKEKNKQITNGMMALSVGATMFALYTMRSEDLAVAPSPYPRNEQDYLTTDPDDLEGRGAEFNREALEKENVPDPIIDIIEGLMHPDVHQRMSVDEAKFRIALFERTQR